MRKKSHISLAKGVIHGLDIHSRINHRLTFYIGSIWPDCTPSFLTKRHCIDDTFDIFMNKISKFVNKFNPKKDMGVLSTLRMGIVMHYIADYFTFPHNTHYDGTLKEHCIYEEELKHRMYRYIDNVKSNNKVYNIPVMTDTNQISEYIKSKHAQYMKIAGNVDSDCSYAFIACMSVVASLLEIVSGRTYVAAAA